MEVVDDLFMGWRHIVGGANADDWPWRRCPVLSRKHALRIAGCVQRRTYMFAGTGEIAQVTDTLFACAACGARWEHTALKGRGP